MRRILKQGNTRWPHSPSIGHVSDAYRSLIHKAYGHSFQNEVSIDPRIIGFQCRGALREEQHLSYKLHTEKKRSDILGRCRGRTTGADHRDIIVELNRDKSTIYR